jgi:hypothetical protein
MRFSARALKFITNSVPNLQNLVDIHHFHQYAAIYPIPRYWTEEMKLNFRVTYGIRFGDHPSIIAAPSGEKTD